MHNMKSFLLSGTLVLAAAGASGCVVSVDSQGQIVREEKRFSVKGVPNLHLATFDGSIELRSSDQHDVVVEIEKRGATKEEIAEVLGVAVSVNAGAAVVYSARALDAFDAAAEANPNG